MAIGTPTWNVSGSISSPAFSKVQTKTAAWTIYPGNIYTPGLGFGQGGFGQGPFGGGSSSQSGGISIPSWTEYTTD